MLLKLKLIKSEVLPLVPGSGTAIDSRQPLSLESPSDEDAVLCSPLFQEEPCRSGGMFDSRCEMRQKRLITTILPRFLVLTHMRSVTSERQVALTFDDGPHAECTPRILDVLYQAGAKATFFMPGYAVKAHPEVARRVLADGHLIGNHSYHHRAFGKLTLAGQLAEIREAQFAIGEVTGVAPSFFRPPQGVLSPGLLYGAYRLGLKTVLCSRDSHDWSGISDQEIARVCSSKHVVSGDIFAFHDDEPATVRALPGICEQIKAEGFKLVCLSETKAPADAVRSPSAPSFPPHRAAA